MGVRLSENESPDEALAERTPFIEADPASLTQPQRHDKTPKNTTRRLYISHTLSTWNSRIFEFGAVLYLASIYPGTLLPMSIYALSRGGAAILLAPAVGWYIDVGNRLGVVKVSIVLQRVVVAASCGIFYLLATQRGIGKLVDGSLLVMLVLLACVEKLCSVMNFVAVEKDWVVVIAGEDQECLTTINAQMRRIDLICKLVGPLFIALIDGISTKVAILTNLGMNVVSVGVEYFSIAKVYYQVPELQEPKQVDNHDYSTAGRLRPTGIWTKCRSLAQKALNDLVDYCHHRVFLPSFAGALLYLTVLSFAGQMVTWLLSAGYTSTQIAIARTISVAFEVAATWAAPWLIYRIGLIRAGLWFASWQVTCLGTGMSVFWRFSSNSLIAASGLVGGTILSRIGLRGFELCTQILVQEDVKPTTRGSFSSTEAAWQNFFEMLSYSLTIIFSRPDQFQWPALTSVVAVGVAGCLYAAFVRVQRGHLVHLPKCLPERRKWSERGVEGMVELGEL